MTEDPITIDVQAKEPGSSKQPPRSAAGWRQRLSQHRALLFSAILLLAGVLLLLNNFDLLPFQLEALWRTFWALFWPLLLIGLGIALLFARNSKSAAWERMRQAGARLPLRRSRSNRLIAGVCGGIAQALGVDALMVRVGWTVLTAITGVLPGVALYFLAALLLPLQD